MNERLPAPDNTRTITSGRTGETRELTPEDLAALRSRTSGNVSFDLTGVQVIDDLLCAVMWASKAYHNTSDWSWTDYAYGPIRDGESWVDLIEALANDGADEIRKAILR